MSQRIIHMSLSVRGALNWPKRRLVGLVMDRDTGKYLHPDRAREWLMDHLAQGHEVVPMCSCPDFDFKTGCPGKTVEAAS